MDFFERTFTIHSRDVTQNRQLRLSAMLGFFQEASISHTENLGMGREKTLDRGLLWIITKQSAEIIRMPRYDETVTLYLTNAKSPCFIRDDESTYTYLILPVNFTR